MQRSFFRDYLRLCSTVFNEFKGQVELLPVDELNFTSFALVIRPKKGLYAHGAFRFLVTNNNNSYPDWAPTVICMNPPWHPNIDARSIDNNVCLNLLSEWSKEFSLNSLISALVFLFYEPNFEDPVHHIGMNSDENLPREKQVHLSLAGCNIDNVRFKANEEWCQWAAENSLLPIIPAPPLASDYTELNELTPQNLPLTDATPQLQQQLSTVSSYYQSVIPIEFDTTEFTGSLIHTESMNTMESSNAFLYHITLYNKDSSQFTHDHNLYRSYTRYYYAEMCSSAYNVQLGNWSRLSQEPSFSQQLCLIQTPQQEAEIGVWEPYFGDNNVLRKHIGRLIEYYYDDQDAIPRTTNEISTYLHGSHVDENVSDADDIQGSHSCDAEVNSHSVGQENNANSTELYPHSVEQRVNNGNMEIVAAETDLKDCADVTIPVSNPVDIQQAALTVRTEDNDSSNPNHLDRSLDKNPCSHVLYDAANLRGDDVFQSEVSFACCQGSTHYSVSNLADATECSNVAVPGVDISRNPVESAESDENTLSQRDQQDPGVENLTAEPVADVSSAIQESNGVPTREDSISSDVEENTCGAQKQVCEAFSVDGPEANRLHRICHGLRLFFMLLRPSWWIFYQTRWPPFTAPGYLFEIDYYWFRHLGSYFYRASALQLIFELSDHRKRTKAITSLVLMDSLALSPFSPVLNRVVLLPLDIIERTEAESDNFILMSIEWISPVQSLLNCFTRSPGEHFRGSALLSMVSLLSNWLAYFSRIELHGTSLGYSHYRDTYVVRPMGIACMYPATLGCGQLPVLDAWPLQLLVHSLRACCSTLVYVSSRLAPCSNFRRPLFRVSFTDVDCI